MRLRRTLVCFLGLFAVTACGSEVSAPQASASSGSGGAPGSGGEAPVPRKKPRFDAKAPTQFSLEVDFNLTAPPEAFDIASYTISGAYGSVAVTAIREGATANIVVLETAKQKLGVDYDLAFGAVGEWDGMTDVFPSADTAIFWTADFTDPAFGEYQVTAARRAVGDRVVIYIAQGMSANNVKATVSHFDDKVYPIETGLFNAAPDQDGNDRVLLLGLDGKGGYGGYFNPTDTLSEAEAFANWGVHSNETDMLYINIASGTFDNTRVVSHEFSHMLYRVSHQFIDSDWSWHNEGLAECAVHAVNGHNNDDVAYYIQDPQGGISAGVSLINWQFANFDQYVLSYMFLSYVAGQKDGIQTFGELFALDGSPAGFDAWLQQELGIGFEQAHRRQLLATWLQQTSGLYSYNQMASFLGQPPVGTDPFSLEPFSGAFRQPASPVSYPGTQGPDVIYIGINGLGDIGETDPFDVSGGALLVFNTSTNMNDLNAQPTGNPIPALPQAEPSASQWPLATVAERTRSLTRLHPPPLNPARREALHQWQRIAHGQ